MSRVECFVGGALGAGPLLCQDLCEQITCSHRLTNFEIGNGQLLHGFDYVGVGLLVGFSEAVQNLLRLGYRVGVAVFWSHESVFGHGAVPSKAASHHNP